MHRLLSLAVLLALLLPGACGAGLKVNLAEPVTLKYRLVDADNHPIDGLTTSTASFWVSKAFSVDVTLQEWSGLTLYDCGLGTYAVTLSAEIVDELGPVHTFMMCEPSPGVVYTGAREDEVVYASSGWQGDEIAIFLLDDADTPFPSCDVRVTNLARNLLIGQETTDIDGKAQFRIPQGTYSVTAWGVGKTFPAADTITVTGSMSFIVRGEEFIPGVPSLPDFGRVFGTLVAADGTPRSGVTIKFDLQAPSASRPITVVDHAVVTRRTVTAVSDSLGAFILDVIPTTSMLPAGLRYKVTISDSPSEVFYVGPKIEAGESLGFDEIL